MANTSILAAFERMWQHVAIAISNKAEKSEIPTKASDLGAAPAYTYGTTDIQAGSASTEPEGTLHFVYQ